MSAVVYALVDPRDNAQRYIGKTLYPEKRLASHLFAATTSKRNYLLNWIRQFLSESVLPVMQVLVICETEKEALRIEVALIKSLRSRGANLTNLTNGGDGAIGALLTEDHKERIASAMRGRPLSVEHRQALKGRVFSQSHRAALRAASLKRYESSDERKATGDRSRGRVASAETRAKISAAAKRQLNTGSDPCLKGCVCGRHKSYKRSPEIREKMRIAQLAFLVSHGPGAVEN